MQVQDPGAVPGASTTTTPGTFSREPTRPSGVVLMGAKQDRLASGRDVETIGGEREIAAKLSNANDNVRMDAQALAA